METSGPPQNDRAVISVHAFGEYRNRQPLAYEPVRTAAAGRVALTDRLEAADLVVVAHTKDLDAHGAELRCSMGPHSGSFCSQRSRSGTRSGGAAFTPPRGSL